MNGNHFIPISREDELKSIIDKAKGEVIKILEIACPTEVSFKRSIKNTHAIFDELLDKIIE